MPRKLLIVLLAFGTVGGYASGFASMAYRAKYGWRGGCHPSRYDAHARPSWQRELPLRSVSPAAAAPTPPPAVQAAPASTTPVHLHLTINAPPGTQASTAPPPPAN